MSKKRKPGVVGTAGNQFEELIAAGKIKFKPATPDDLEPWGKSLVLAFLARPQIQFKLGDQKVGNSYCLKLQDKFLQYLDIHPDTKQFLWCIDNHHDSIKPDHAGIYLAEREGLDVHNPNARRTLEQIGYDFDGYDDLKK